MRFPTLILSTVALCSIELAGPSRAQEAGSPKGKPLPGPFQTLSVNGPRPGKYYCPVCESGLNPGVVIFFRDVEEPDKPLPRLLKQIDDVLAKYPDARTDACAVCLNDGGYREALVSKTDTLDAAMSKRQAQERRLKDLAGALQLRAVTFGLGADPDTLKEYGIAPDADATVIVYDRQQVLGSLSLAEDKIDDAQVGAILKLIESTAAAAQQRAHPKRKR